MNDTSDLAPWEVRALVSHLMYRLSLEDRRRLMNELPQVYNKLCGRTIVTTVVKGSEE